jgi:hypothetical protein
MNPAQSREEKHSMTTLTLEFPPVKHGRALVEAGYLDRPSPVANVPAPIASKPAVAPITRKDLARAAMFRIKLPVAPMAVEAQVEQLLKVEELPPVVDDHVEVAQPATVDLRPARLPRFEPTPEMEMERLGYELGNAGENARAPEGRSFAELVAFYSGFLQGRADLEAEYNAWLESVEADRERMDDAFGSPEDTWPEAELLEARQYSGHPAYEG